MEGKYTQGANEYIRGRLLIVMFWNFSFAIENYVLTVKHLDLFSYHRSPKNDKNFTFPTEMCFNQGGKAE